MPETYVTQPCRACGTPTVSAYRYCMSSAWCQIANRACQDNDPNATVSIYALYSRNELLYVGQSVNPSSRYSSHVNGEHGWSELITSYVVLAEGTRSSVDWFERQLIELYNPIGNNMYADRNKHHAVGIVGVVVN